MNIAIIGSGTMGSGIAQLAAQAGCNVLVMDSNQSALTRAVQNLDSTLTRLQEKNKISAEEKMLIQERISWSSSIDSIADSQLVIEAIIEDLNIKKELFISLGNVVSQDCVLASNTSSLSITQLGASVVNPSRFMGIHFFNPAPLMPLVECIPSIETDLDLFNKTCDEITRWKKVVVKAKDTPGFIVNRLARLYYGESIRQYEEGIANFETIDAAMKSVGFKMGPFELMDMIGNDVNYAVTELVWQQLFFDTRFTPSQTQKQLSMAGYFGRKTKRGYYDYRQGEPTVNINENKDVQHAISMRTLVMLVNQATEALQLQLATSRDIEIAMTKGVNYPKGLLQWGNDLGLDYCVAMLDNLYNTYHEDRYRCCTLIRHLAASGQQFIIS
ncbi:MAG: NAD(P)-binding domain-containing protein [Bacteroidetes bacterium]|nr:NAD(P)-binding domain-containing protein [Bacteroidota bacterium]